MISENAGCIIKRVEAAAERAGRRPGEVKILAVSKTKPASMVMEAFEAGLRFFGENYLQDARRKLDELSGIRQHTCWHFIGHLQRNKAKAAVELFDCIETLDSLRLAEAINRHARAMGVVRSVFVQVNIGLDPAKSGILPDETVQFLEECAGFEHISIDGLMTIPPVAGNSEETRTHFSMMRELFHEMQERFCNILPLKELSMGMSGDFEIAIEEGATIVRIGTMLFGPRLK